MENDRGMTVHYFSTTLKDPLTRQRMKLPARGEQCKHLQCFKNTSNLSFLKNHFIDYYLL